MQSISNEKKRSNEITHSVYRTYDSLLRLFMSIAQYNAFDQSNGNINISKWKYNVKQFVLLFVQTKFSVLLQKKTRSNADGTVG